MNQINSRGTYMCSMLCLPHLLKADNPHVIKTPFTAFSILNNTLLFVAFDLHSRLHSSPDFFRSSTAARRST